MVPVRLLSLLLALPAGAGEPSAPRLPPALQARIEGRSASPVQGLFIDPEAAQRNWPMMHIGWFQAAETGDSAGCSKVVVGVVDTGIDYTHPALRDHIWINAGESGPWRSPEGWSRCSDKSCNGIDDDGNGFVDDVIGWDFTKNRPLPYDEHGHGTHVAGIISAAAAGGGRVVGVCPGARLMALKYYSDGASGALNLERSRRALTYALKMGVDVINYSGGGPEADPRERNALARAAGKDILIVAAAGNEGKDTAVEPFYPGAYGLANVLTVGSVDRDGDRAPSSNFGGRVDMAAPGVDVLSTVQGGEYAFMSGSSQGTAFVSGAAALLIAQAKGVQVGYAQLKRWLTRGSEPLPVTNPGSVRTGILSIPGSLHLMSYELAARPVRAPAKPAKSRKKPRRPKR